MTPSVFNIKLWKSEGRTKLLSVHWIPCEVPVRQVSNMETVTFYRSLLVPHLIL